MDDLERKWWTFQELFMQQPKSYETHIFNHLFMNLLIFFVIDVQKVITRLQIKAVKAKL